MPVYRARLIMPQSIAAEAGTKCCKFIQQAILRRGGPAGGSRGDLFPKWLCPGRAALPGLRDGTVRGSRPCLSRPETPRQVDRDARHGAEGREEAC